MTVFQFPLFGQGKDFFKNCFSNSLKAYGSLALIPLSVYCLNKKISINFFFQYEFRILIW